MTYFQHKSMLIEVPEVQLYRGRGFVQIVGIDVMKRIEAAPAPEQPQNDPPKKPRHHDHLLERHIRSHRRN